ncbi:MAG: permease [Planctomycetota bacterium]
MSLLPEFGVAFAGVLLQSAPVVVLGFVIAGLLHEFVPASLLRRGVAGRSLAPVLRVVGVGTLLPICSCSTIPLGIGLTRCGASSGTALAFMTSSPAVSPIALVLGWSVLGPALVGWYATLALGAAVLVGVCGNRWLRDTAPPEREPAGCGCGCEGTPRRGARLSRALRWSLLELGPEVSRSLLAGLAVASLVLVAMPSGVVDAWLGEPSWLALVGAVAISLPAYTCSVPSLLIAGSLIARGVDPGVAVVFLIAGPATNLGELNAIRVAMGGRAAVFYAAMLIAIALAGGAATSLLPLPAAVALPTHAGHAHAHTLDTVVLGGQMNAEAAGAMPTTGLAWRAPFAALILGLTAASLARGLRPQRAEPKAPAPTPPATNQPPPNLVSITVK